MLKKTKELIEITIKNLPNRSDTVSIRNYLTKALIEIKKIENKKENKKNITPHQKWQLDIKSGSLQNMDLKSFNNAISTIESLISKEQEKLNNKNNSLGLIND